MTEQCSFAGFESMAASFMLFTIVPAIRFAALEREMMGYIKNPSPHLDPLLEMIRIRARYLLRAMTGLFLSALIFLFCKILIDFLPSGATSINTALLALIAGLTGYAIIQMLLEVRVTLIGFTYHEENKNGIS